MSTGARGAITLLTTVLISAAMTTACGGFGSSIRTTYVALGDSAVAGAGISPSSTGICPRSTNNYPALVARHFHVDTFVDRSCPGATTHDILHTLSRNGMTVPAQISSVTQTTDVVTISIGGNDGEAIPALFLSCYIPGTSSSQACRLVAHKFPSLLRTTRIDIIGALEAIRKRAPHAMVVLVSYLRLMPDTGPCATVPISPADLAIAAAAEGELEVTMQTSASAAGVRFVNMRGPSVGHDACADKDKAWVSALVAAPGDGTYLHPRASGMKSVASAVEPVVESRLGK